MAGSHDIPPDARDQAVEDEAGGCRDADARAVPAPGPWGSVSLPPPTRSRDPRERADRNLSVSGTLHRGGTSLIGGGGGRRSLSWFSRDYSWASGEGEHAGDAGRPAAQVATRRRRHGRLPGVQGDVQEPVRSEWREWGRSYRSVGRLSSGILRSVRNVPSLLCHSRSPPRRLPAPPAHRCPGGHASLPPGGGVDDVPTRERRGQRLPDGRLVVHDQDVRGGGGHSVAPGVPCL